MQSYHKKPVVVQAEQWFKIGDVPEAPIGPALDTLDKADPEELCTECGNVLRAHGLCETLGGHHIVCPGDWIVKGVRGEFYPVKPDVFQKTYEKVEVED